MMQPNLITIPSKKLIGKHLTMSIAANRTAELWRSFMPRRKEIVNTIGSEYYSLQVYGPDYFSRFNPTATFEKWAAAEVPDFNNVPADMQTFTLPGGLYAVFHYKGLSTDTSIFQYIFGTWLPGSNYELDNRPHFETLGEKYKNNDPESEEDIWVPVKLKDQPKIS